MIKKKLDYERAAREAFEGWHKSQDLSLEMCAARNEAIQQLRNLEEVYLEGGRREDSLLAQRQQDTAYIRDLEYRLLALSELHRTTDGGGICLHCSDYAPCATMKIVTGL